MIKDKKKDRSAAKDRVRRRINSDFDRSKYKYIPEEKPVDFYDNDVEQRVGIYVRVSTDDIRQTTSFELQRKYYEDFVDKHPHWKLVKIYADEGISGTSTKKRDAFNQMVADAKAHKLDLIITKSVSRFARNVEDFLGTIRALTEQKPPVGVFFESEAIFSLNDDSQMALSFQSVMAEEESHTRSRSMESSLRMRLDNGLPLTPPLLGYNQTADGGLEINPDEKNTVKLAFFMYLYGYSTQQIADAFIALEKASYKGNTTLWTSTSIVQILRNERHCGDVFTRKTYTTSFKSHKKAKNINARPHSWYYDHHDAIVSRDDYLAVQHLLDNMKYGNKSLMPELRVIDSGMLKGFVVINPRWAGFKEQHYFEACRSVYDPSAIVNKTDEIQIEVQAGDFDLRGFEITRSEFFETTRNPNVTFNHKKIKFSTACVRKFDKNNHIEMLINPISRKFAIRPTTADNRSSVVFSKLDFGKYYPKDVSTAAFSETLYSLFGWNTDYKYRILGSLYEQDGEIAYVFDVKDSEAYFKTYVLPTQGTTDEGKPVVQPLMPSGKRIRAIPESWTTTFGKEFYIHEKSLAELERQSEEDWMLRLEGQIIASEERRKITSFAEIKAFIQQELKGINMEEAKNAR